MSISNNIRAGAAYVEVTAETSKLQRNLTSAQAQLQTFGRACTTIGRDLLMVSGAIALPLGMAVKGFADFDDQMRMVKGVTKSTQAEFEQLTKVASKLGRETSFTAKQVADGMTSFGRTGFSPKEIENAISPTLDLARATGTELGEAADIAANSMRIFGLESSQMVNVVDVLTATANGSAQTLTDLFEALKMAGPQAKAAGENISDTNAALGILANVGIKGSLAGTALRKSFSQFAKVKVQEQLKAVGVETVDASGNLRKMADIMADIGRVMNTLPTAERIAFAEDIFDIRGSLAGLSLGGNVKQLEDFIAKLQDVNGTARQTAQEMDAGLGGSFRKLYSAVEGAMNAIGASLTPTLQPLVDKVTAVTLAVIEWIEANSGLVTAFAVTVAGAASLGIALITIGVAAKGAAAGIAVVQTTLKAFTLVQGLCVAQGTTLGTSFGLITSAFRNYRNMAIPALVSTEQLIAAFGLASTATNRATASLILMSNAEAAAIGKAKLSAIWQGATTALKSFSMATMGSTVALQAQTVAQTLSAVATKVLTVAKVGATKAIMLFSGANLKAVASLVAAKVATLTLAVAVKGVAAAFLVAKTALLAFLANPIALAITAIVGALALLCVGLYKAGSYTAQLSDKMSNLRQKGDELRNTDKLRMERLQQLAEKQKLSTAEMAEAESLTSKLSSKYGEFGASIDKVADKLNLATDAQNKLNEAMKKAAIAELDSEISEMQANLGELKNENEALLSYWNHNVMSLVTGKQSESVAKIATNGDKAVAYQQKIDALKQRKKAIQLGDEDAITGESSSTTTAENVETEKQKKATSLQENADAQARVAQIDKQLSRERQTALQNEIADINALRDEYKSLVQAMLDYEQSKADNLQDKKRIAELESKLVDADKIAEERIAQAQEKASAEFSSIESSFNKNAKNIQDKRLEDATDRELEQTLKTDKDAGIEMLQNMIISYQQAAEQAKLQFQEELKKAQGDGVINDAERSKINEAESAYSRAESMFDKYESKLRDAQEGTRQSSENTQVQGAFLAQALDGLSNGTAADRTAKATETIASNTSKTNDYLKKNLNNLQFT